MQIIQRVHLFWLLLVFGVVFLVLFPFFCVAILFPKWKKFFHFINLLWGRSSLFLSGLQIQAVREAPIEHYPVIFCANHFSYLDILSFSVVKSPFKFIGKNELAGLPLFGFMFRKLHISVDRSSLIGSYRAYEKSKKELDNGYSLAIFPEGGIFSKQAPQMVRFKEGAFRLAVEKQIPIVPVSFPDNWIILPDQKWPRLKRKKIRVIFHEPIATEGKTEKDIEELKKRTFDKIQDTLNRYNKHESRQEHLKEDRSFIET